jgi:hypothetical protein
MNKNTTLSLTLHCFAKMDQADDGHMIGLQVVNHGPVLNIIGEPILDKIKASYVCTPTNYQPLYKALNYAIEKKGYREHMSCPVFYYDLNLN